MTGFYEGLRGSARGALCQVLSSGDRGLGLVQRQLGVAGPILAPHAAIVRALRRGVCGEPALPDPPPPSTGGQCICTAYQVNVSGTLNGNPYQNTYIADGLQTMFGPMSYAGQVSAPGSQFVSTAVKYWTCSGGQQVEQKTAYLGSFGQGQLTGVSVSFTPRFASGSNDCGDEEPIIEPPSPEDVTFIFPDFTWVTNEGDTINEGDLNITLGFAYIDANANFNIPVRFELGVDSIFGDINQNGDVNFDFSRNTHYGPEDGPAFDPEDDTDAPEPVEPAPSPEPEGEQAIIGVVVTVTQLGTFKATEIFQDENPNIFGPRLGSVNFLCKIGGRNAAWTADIDVKNIRQIIECPWPIGAIDVKGTPQSGVNWVLTPIINRVNVPIFPT